VAFLDDEVNSAMVPPGAASAVAVVEVRHQAIRDQLSDYLDATLSDPERAQVEEHLQRCRACRGYLATLQATREVVRKLPRERAPESARRRLLQIPQLEGR
jgi:anti-sigma factor RsiW